MEVQGSGALGRKIPFQAWVGPEALVSLLPSLWSWLGNSLSTFYPDFLLWTLASLASLPWGRGRGGRGREGDFPWPRQLLEHCWAALLLRRYILVHWTVS